MARQTQFLDGKNAIGAYGNWNLLGGSLGFGEVSSIAGLPQYGLVLMEHFDYEPGDRLHAKIYWVPVTPASGGVQMMSCEASGVRPLGAPDAVAAASLLQYGNYSFGHRLLVPTALSTSTVYETITPGVRTYPRATLFRAGRYSSQLADTHGAETTLIGFTVYAAPQLNTPTPEELAEAHELTGWWDPSNLGTITADGSNLVTLWDDLSEFGNDWVGAAGDGPVTGSRTINGLNALDFISDRLTSVSWCVSQPFSTSFVMQTDTVAAQQHLLASFPSLAITSTGQLTLSMGTTLSSATVPAPLDTNPHVITIVVDGEYTQIRVDGEPVAFGTVGDGHGASSMSFGSFSSSTSNRFDGLLGEMLVWGGAYRPDNVEAYLMDKWL